LYCSPSDRYTQEFFIDKIGENNTVLSPSQVETLQTHARKKLDQVFNYAYRSRCRRRAILEYFGDRTVITHCACDVCRGMVRSRPAAAVAGNTPRRPAKDNRAKPTVENLNQAADLRFERLKKVRLELAAAEGWPAFCICHNKVLIEVARVAPLSLSSLAAIKGVGDNKAKKFGAAFLKALQE
jgi:ATP-dependent DNA helicase RecQ